MESGKYIVFPYEIVGDEGSWYGNATRVDEMPNCSCRYFEFIGIPCSHILAYINFSRLKRLPERLIKARWTKGIKDDLKIQIYDDEGVDSKWNDYTDLTRQANELINVVIRDKRKKKYILLRHLNQANSEFEESGLFNDVGMSNYRRLVTLENKTGKRSITMFNKNLSGSEINVKNPPMAKTKDSGRSGQSKLGVAKRLKYDSEFLTKKARMCKKCSILNAGHDSRNYHSNKMTTIRKVT